MGKREQDQRLEGRCQGPVVGKPWLLSIGEGETPVSWWQAVATLPTRFSGSQEPQLWSLLPLSALHLSSVVFHNATLNRSSAESPSVAPQCP